MAKNTNSREVGSSKNVMNSIIQNLNTNTTLVRFIQGENGNLSAIDTEKITDITQNDIMACNIVLQAYLTGFGLDIRTIARTAVADVNPALIDMRNLLTNAKWETTSITIDSVTKTAMEWIEYRFQIFDKVKFIDTLFRRLNDHILNGHIDDDNTIIDIDIETYTMIKLIALAFGADINFASIYIGDEQIINIPLDLENVNDTFTYIGNMLIDKGYVDESLRDNFTISGWMQFSLQPVTGATGNAFNNNVGFNNNGEFKYLHCYVIESIINTSTKVWTPVIFATKKEIKPIVFEQVNVTYSNQSGYVGYKAHLYDKTTSAEDMTKQYMVWYGRNHGNDSGSSYQNIWYDMATQTQIFSDNELINGADETYNVYYNGGLGRGNSVNYNELGTYVAFPIRRWNSVYVSSEMKEIFLNNQYLGSEPLPAPSTDSSVYADMGHMEIGDIWSKFPLKLNADNIGWLTLPKTPPFDTGDKFDIHLIDINTGVDLRTGKPYTSMVEDSSVAYKTRFSSTVPYINNSRLLGKNPGQTYQVITDDYNINNFIDYLWNDNVIDWVVNKIAGLKPFDCIKSLKMLPFLLREGTDYEKEQSYISMGGYACKDIVSGDVQTPYSHNLSRVVRILTTKPVLIGAKQQWDYKYFYGPYQKITKTEDDSYLNYEPYSKASIYIPFVGERDIEMSMIYNKWVYVEYQVFIPTGDFVASVKVYDFDDKVSRSLGGDKGYAGEDAMKSAYPILNCAGNMSVDMDFGGKEYNNAISGLGGVITGVLGAIGFAASGGTAGVVSSLIGAGSSALSMVEASNRYSNSSMNNITGYLTNWTPYITLYTHECIKGYKDTGDASAFNQTIGMKSERGIKIKHMDNGFHKVKGIKLDGLKCTQKERDMIEAILTNGFYFAGGVDSSAD